MPRLTLHLLGPPMVELDGQGVQLGRHKAVALLAYLALTRQPHSRDALATLLWPDLDQSHARGQLRRTLSLLNRTLGEEWLAVDRETVAWAADAEAWVDVDRLRERLAACATHGHPIEQTCAECVSLLAGAVELYRDGFMAGFTLPDAPAFDEWQFFEGEGLRDGVSGALQRLARRYGDQGEYDAAIPYARRWLALDPLHEPAQRELMTLYARSGQRTAALRQYGECERVLDEELGVPPSQETSALYEAIRSGRELPVVTPAEGAGPSALPTPRRHNLPLQGTPFVGRRQELGELDRLLAPTAEARLVTVVGPGGMGKTRLALEAASRQLAHYPDGVWFVSLAPVQSAEAIVPTVAQVLGVSFFGADPPRQQLLRYLRGKRMLLVLDNLEHLLEGVDLLVELLRTAPGVKILVTSRVRLNLRGEQAFALKGMDYPELPAGMPVGDDVRRYDSVALFARSARRARLGFELTEKSLPHVAHICQLAQGMPLAILLAAAWVPALTPAEIAAEMERSLDFLTAEWRDEPERHHSMRAVFDATWARLREEERTIFARLSVFRGGFTREAAQAVAGTDLRTLVSLVNKSLLQHDRGGRYEVHELLRQYGEEQLGKTPEEREETLDLHCEYYTELLSEDVRGALSELDNIRTAWRRAVLRAKWDQIRKCCANLGWSWEFQGWFQEEAVLFEMAVDALRAEKPLGDVGVALGMVLVGLGHASMRIGHRDKAKHLFQEGLDLLRRLEKWQGLAWGNSTAVAMGAVQDYPEAERLLQESLKIYQEMGDASEAARMCFLLGSLALRHGAYYKAEQYCQRALESDDVRGLVLYCMGNIAYALGEYGKARQLYEESLILCQEMGYQLGVATIQNYLGDVALAIGEHEEARKRHWTALGMFREMNLYWGEALSGDRWGIVLSLERLGETALIRGDDREAKRYYRQALETVLELSPIESRLYVLLGPAELLAQEGHVERAAELAALARHHPASIGETRDKADELLDELQLRLSPEAYAAAKARGRARDLEATMRELLAELGHT
jgi:predicted ATPase/DNA-binding SARP family transcriptional activator